ncbi:MAG: tetratricopeptide repeat protein [Proteobacteria bacterium]|nr:tetratricopeptide repeat protein [Pseudomonadota bacterium]
MKRILVLLLLGAAATPLAAQSAPDLNARVTKVEKELRAVQRKVFPDGQPLEPEITPPPRVAEPLGSPASNPIADLTARVDALESQIRALTGQSEQNAHRIGQLEDQVKQLVADAQARAAAPVAPPTLAPAEEPAAPAVERPSTGDAAEDGYIYGFRLWQARNYAEAETALKQVADKYPKHRRASFAQNLLGRAYLDDGKPALAAVALYDSYKKWPKGERAPESLYWLGEALIALKKPADACKVYAQFDDDYGATAPAALKTQIAGGRKKAKCA